jgi:hypothetical protein
LPGELSEYATPGPPLSKASAWITPGTAAGVPLTGVGAAGGVAADGEPFFGTMVQSPVTCPGALDSHVEALSTI